MDDHNENDTLNPSEWKGATFLSYSLFKIVVYVKMAHFYHVTAQKASAVVTACTGQFTGPNDLNLIVAKNTYLEVNEVTAEGLKLIKEIPLFCKIIAIKLFRTKDQKKDSLFIVTNKAEAAIVECHKESNETYEFVTIASGSFEEKSLQRVEDGYDILIDPDQKLLLIRFYLGLLKVITLPDVECKAGDFGDGKDLLLFTHNLRMEEFYVIDMVFLHGYSHPTIAVMYEDEVGLHIKSYEVDVKSGLKPVAWNYSSIQPGSVLLQAVPPPFDGCLVVGQQAVCYHAKDGHYVAQAIPQAKHCATLCICQVDDLRYLLGDLAGRLYMVHLVRGGAGQDEVAVGLRSDSCSNPNKIVAVRVELLGETVVPKCIRYLDNGVIYVGASLGDSQLVRLGQVGDEKLDFVTVLEKINNIGPIVDMVLLDRDKQGQNQLITASGAFKEGTLRVIRSGIGIHERASIEQEMIKAAWPFRCRSDSKLDDSILISLVGQTQALALKQDDIEPLELPGLEVNLQTYHHSQVGENLILQVTLNSIRLIGTHKNSPKGLLDEWKPPSGKSVSQCNSWKHQIVAASGPDLYYIVVDNNKLKEVSHHHLDQEVACLDLTPFNSDVSNMVAVGLWIDFSVVLFSLPDLKVLLKEHLDSNVIPRSLLITQLEDSPRLFIAMGDGTLIYYILDVTEGCLRDCKKANVGTGPMYLRHWITSYKKSVFVCSDHPCIIYSSNSKLVFVNVNLKEVTHMCPLNSEFYTDCLALVSSSCLIFGSVDDIQKLHVRTIQLEETPKRLVFQEETGTLGVISIRKETVSPEGVLMPVRPSASVSSKIARSSSRVARISHDNLPENEDIDVSSFLILDLFSMEVLAAHTFSVSNTCVEMALSLCSCVFPELGNEPCFIVGTAYIVEDEPEPKSGRIHILRWKDKQRIEVLCEQEVNGAPYCIEEFNGKLLVAINSSVRLFEYKEKSLRIVCGHYEHVLCLYLAKKGDFVLVGDMMRSVTLHLYKPSLNSLEIIGSHRYPRWTTAVDFVDNDLFMASDMDLNLYVVSEEAVVNNATLGPEDSRKLTECACIHTGEFINRFLHGSLVMQTSPERGLPISNPILYGGVNGSLGMLCQLTQNFFNFLKEVQKRMSRLVKSVGNFSHEGWRSFKSSKISKVAENFIDGDLIEIFLDLNSEDKLKLLEEPLILPVELRDPLKSERESCTMEDLNKIIEELNRLH